jgi:RND family efflux transporter MFP subunit
MNMPTFLKKKKTYVFLIIILMVGWWWYSKSNVNVADLYETDTVKKIDLSRTVEVTGSIKPAERINLSFEASGKLAQLNKKVGDEVKAGDVIAQLGDADLLFSLQRAEATLATAKANLNLKKAGETSQAIRVAETDVERAQANYDKSLVDLENVKITTSNNIKASELALKTAESNLSNTGETNQQSIDDAVTDLRTSLVSCLGSMESSLSDGDAIIGVDDGATNASYENLLGISDSTSKSKAENDYGDAKSAKILAESLVRALTDDSTEADILIAASSTQDALVRIQTYLSDVQRVLSATISGSNLTATQISTKKTTIDADRVSISSHRSSVETALQTLTNAKLGKTTDSDTLQNSYETAKLNLEIAKAQAETQLKDAESASTINTASLSASRAVLDLKKSGPRDVDLEPLYATLMDAEAMYAQAMSNLKKAQIIAPVDGVVSDIIPSLGEQVTTAVVAVKMVGLSMYDIEVLLPEADVAKVELGQTATITLDAYGDSVSFNGAVVTIDPDQTVVQDAVYYKSRVQLEPREDIEFMPGMTANVTILTANKTQVLVVPTRAVKTDQETGIQTVRILDGKTVKEQTIKTGLKGDEGKIEVTEGLLDGQTIIVADKTK